MKDISIPDRDEGFNALSLLAKGSRAEVYLGEDKKETGRKLALKFMREDIFPDKTTGNHHLACESRLLSLCAHDNVLSFVKTATNEDGRVCMATEYLQGKTLKQMIAGGPIEVSRIGKIFIPLTCALENMHKMGVSHLDLRPDKVIIEENNDNLHPKIIGFGRADFLPWAGQELPIEARHKSGIYSLQYMSPEQIMEKRCLPTSDVYSLGCILYEALAGRPAFKGENELHTMAQHLSGSVPYPSELRGDPSLRKLDEVVMQSIARETHMRFLDAAELREALAAALPSRSADGWLAKLFKK